MRAVLGAILPAAGHDVVSAECVDVGLDLYRFHRPDVVLTDYTMPGKTGCDLVSSLRADGFENPIFAISSELDPSIRAAMASAGADLWLPKPVCAATLLTALQYAARTAAKPSRRVPPRAQAQLAQLG
jgi:two-component system chemotaxis response regulator CheY